MHCPERFSPVLPSSTPPPTPLAHAMHCSVWADRNTYDTLTITKCCVAVPVLRLYMYSDNGRYLHCISGGVLTTRLCND